MANSRVFWACESVHFAECGTNTFTKAGGVQSVGITTKFTLDQIFELGQIAIYELAEQVPDIEVTTEKVIDGGPLLYHLATKNSTSATLAGRGNRRATVGLAIFGDTQDSASGVPIARCVMSGMYVSSLTYTIPEQGPCTESLTLVGNNKIWSQAFSFTDNLGLETPPAGSASGNTQQRQDVVFGACDTSVSQPTATVLPADIPGLTASGTNVIGSDGNYPAHLKSIRISANLGRTPIYSLGTRSPYFRAPDFPIQVSTDIEVTAHTGDLVTADESNETNLTNRKIFVRLKDGTKLDLGSSNKLQSVSYTGGNAGQNQVRSISFNYINFNQLSPYHPADPSGL